MKQKKNTIGKTALIDKKRFLMLIFSLSDKTLLKLVSKQNQIDIKKNIYM